MKPILKYLAVVLALALLAAACGGSDDEPAAEDEEVEDVADDEGDASVGDDESMDEGDEADVDEELVGEVASVACVKSELEAITVPNPELDEDDRIAAYMQLIDDIAAQVEDATGGSGPLAESIWQLHEKVADDPEFAAVAASTARAILLAAQHEAGGIPGASGPLCVEDLTCVVAMGVACPDDVGFYTTDRCESDETSSLSPGPIAVDGSYLIAEDIVETAQGFFSEEDGFDWVELGFGWSLVTDTDVASGRLDGLSTVDGIFETFENDVSASVLPNVVFFLNQGGFNFRPDGEPPTPRGPNAAEETEADVNVASNTMVEASVVVLDTEPVWPNHMPDHVHYSAGTPGRFDVFGDVYFGHGPAIADLIADALELAPSDGTRESVVLIPLEAASSAIGGTVSHPSGTVRGFDTSAVVGSLAHAALRVDENVVLNLSLSSVGCPALFSAHPLLDWINANPHVTVVAAAGNSGGNGLAEYPAGWSSVANVRSVGALDANDGLQLHHETGIRL